MFYIILIIAIVYFINRRKKFSGIRGEETIFTQSSAKIRQSFNSLSEDDKEKFLNSLDYSDKKKLTAFLNSNEAIYSRAISDYARISIILAKYSTAWNQSANDDWFMQQMQRQQHEDFLRQHQEFIDESMRQQEQFMNEHNNMMNGMM